MAHRVSSIQLALLWLVGLSIGMGSWSAAAEQPAFVLEGLTTWSHDGRALDSGADSSVEIPLSLRSRGPGIWVLEIDPEAFHPPVMRSPEGGSVRWGLSSKATGFLMLERDEWMCSVQVPLVALSESGEIIHSVPLQFTTGAAERLKGTSRSNLAGPAIREGKPYDRATGEIELVAASSARLEAGSDELNPVFSSLRGRIVGLPPEVAEAKTTLP